MLSSFVIYCSGVHLAEVLISLMQNGLGKGETMNKYVNELTALGRTSEPEDVAKAVSFLVCLHSSRFLATCS
jgi:enoyl-[acyl-carrier-protein] reductase (NADH)